ncbi:phosphotransferase enzyme family protein [Zymoseptoria brevis]|uniref:Altered inheritance of mitochondria protein 9, mitochondrial n=1 Tax=Zymoseptoria brevis TaxID=1047168 RepID=A0A0F4GGZ6_9PEZI|nr:phosphotransferase enzyme family protein [Zymoseptoria brevis]
MNRLYHRFRAVKTQDFSAIERSPPHATVAGSARRRRVHSSRQNSPSNRSNQMPVALNGSDSSWSMDVDMGADAEFFNFTRGRFVANEQHELAQRHRTFNVGELARHAARAVKANRCLAIKKRPDGMYNRVLLLSMDNGKEVVAKIPNPNAGQPHFTTASEVATMKFAREVLRTPLPEVYAWSSRAQETLVGAEFILMEKVNGVELERFLPGMRIQDRLEVVKTIAEYHKSWASVSFEQFGSLYFAEDVGTLRLPPLAYLDQEGRKVSDPRFVVGPSTGREMFDDGRAGIEFDRGPWKSLEAYHTAIGEREIACVQHILQLPSSPVSLHGPGLYQPTREKKIQALEVYLRLFPHLLPIDRRLGLSHLWHGDLHAGNIFVDPSEPTRVVGLIDWQSTELSPLYFQARQPHFIDYEGPTVRGLERPTLPPDFAQLDEGEKRVTQALFYQQSLCALYRKILHQACPKVFECFEFQGTPAFALLLLARNILIDGEASYMAQAYELESIWDTLPGAQGAIYPLSFSVAEVETIHADLELAAMGMQAMRRMREALGDLFPQGGYVPSDRHQKAVDVISRTRAQVLSDIIGGDSRVNEHDA